jgi:hypothetical protein
VGPRVMARANHRGGRGCAGRSGQMSIRSAGPGRRPPRQSRPGRKQRMQLVYARRLHGRAARTWSALCRTRTLGLSPPPLARMLLLTGGQDAGFRPRSAETGPGLRFVAAMRQGILVARLLPGCNRQWLFRVPHSLEIGRSTLASQADRKKICGSSGRTFNHIK